MLVRVRVRVLRFGKGIKGNRECGFGVVGVGVVLWCRFEKS